MLKKTMLSAVGLLTMFAVAGLGTQAMAATTSQTSSSAHGYAEATSTETVIGGNSATLTNSEVTPFTTGTTENPGPDGEEGSIWEYGTYLTSETSKYVYSDYYSPSYYHTASVSMGVPGDEEMEGPITAYADPAAWANENMSGPTDLEGYSYWNDSWD